LNEGSRKTALVIGAVAAAAGIAIASAILIRRSRTGGPPQRTVSDVLQDCREKLGDIQRHLSDISRTALQTPAMES
jgi:hypothetical protein